MKTITIHINDNIYDDFKRFLSIFSSDKLKIEEPVPEIVSHGLISNYKDFEKKWAGFIRNYQLDENWKEDRISYLKKKHQ